LGKLGGFGGGEGRACLADPFGGECRLQHRLQILPRQVSCHDEGHVVRCVARTVILAQRVGVYLREQFRVADDGQTVGVVVEGRLEDPPRDAPVGVVHVHRDLAQDHVALALQLLVVQPRVKEHVVEDLHGLARPFDRAAYVVHRAVVGRVGVYVPADRLHLRGDLRCAARGRTLEEHVLKVVRHARP
jgi:hypothetical protein